MTFGVIYKITNKINGKAYIGKTQDFNERQFAHYKASKNKNSYISVLYRAINKYGWKNFNWEIICECETLEELNEKEIYFIKEYKTFIHDENSNGYNLTLGGDGISGHKHSEESLKLISEASIKLWENEEHRALQKIRIKEAVNTKECKEKLKITRATPEYHEKRSKLTKELWQDKEIRDKIYLKHKERWEDPEFKERMHKANLEMHSKPENKAKLTKYVYIITNLETNEEEIIFTGLKNWCVNKGVNYNTVDKVIIRKPIKEYAGYRFQKILKSEYTQ